MRFIFNFYLLLVKDYRLVVKACFLTKFLTRDCFFYFYQMSYPGYSSIFKSLFLLPLCANHKLRSTYLLHKMLINDIFVAALQVKTILVTMTTKLEPKSPAWRLKLRRRIGIVSLMMENDV